MKKFIVSTFISLSMLLAGLLSFSAIASSEGSASAFLSSDATSYDVGATFTVWVGVEVSSGTAGAVEANMNYDASKLAFDCIVSTGDLDASLEQTISSGRIHIVKGKMGGFSGQATVYGVKFKALSAGSTTINLDTSHIADSSGSFMTLSLDNLSLTLSTPTTPVTPPTTPMTPTTSTTPTVKKKTTTTKKYTTVIQTISPEKSSVTFDKVSGIADGQDKICASISVKNTLNKAVTNIKPDITVLGGLDVLDETLSGEVWQACLISLLPGAKSVSVSVSGIVLKNQDIEFMPKEILSPKKEETTEPIITPMQMLNNSLSAISGTVTVANAKDSSAQKEITDKDLILVSGTGTAGSLIRVYVHSDSVVTKETTVDDDGNWSVQTDQPLAVGEHRAEVLVYDKYGNESTTKLLSRFNVVKKSTLGFTLIVSLIIFVVLSVGYFFWRKIRQSKNVLPLGNKV